MIRSQLQNKLFKYGREIDASALKNQRNYCNRLYKRERKAFYSNLKVNKINDNKFFWKTMKLLNVYVFL